MASSALLELGLELGLTDDCCVTGITGITGLSGDLTTLTLTISLFGVLVSGPSEPLIGLGEFQREL